MAEAEPLDRWADRIRELGAAEFSRRLRARLAALSLQLASVAKRNATTAPKVRSGRLRASIRSSVVDDAGMPTVLLQAGGSAGGRGEVVYAPLQEFGGTVRPRVADFLRIPLGPSLTDSGDERFGGSLRSYSGEGFYVFQGSSGGLFIGKSGDEVAPGVPRAWYKLVKEVTVPRTLFLGRTMDEVAGKLEPELADLFRVALASDRRED